MRTVKALLFDRLECMRVKPLLQSYLDGELTPEQARLVSRHLDACRRCGLAARTLRDMKASLSRLGNEPNPQAAERLGRFVDGLGPED